MTKLECVRHLKEEFRNLDFGDLSSLDRLQKRGAMLIRNTFGERSRLLSDFFRIDFRGGIATFDAQKVVFARAKVEMLNLLQTAEDELTMFPEADPIESSVQPRPSGNEVFVVHGHDDGMKLEVTRMLERVGLQPLILHEAANLGRTIIEKFSDHSNVAFAVVLLSADDVGYAKRDGESTRRPRARQNVLLELGFFIGKLGRDRVAVLVNGPEDFEFPSDYEGVIYIPYDRGWPLDLAKELRAVGLKIDPDKLIG